VENWHATDKKTVAKRRARLRRERVTKLNSDFELHQMAMIAALGRVPSTEHGLPDWPAASEEDRRLASALIEYSLPHAKRSAHSLISVKGHTPYHERSHIVRQVEFGPRDQHDEDEWLSTSQISQRLYSAETSCEDDEAESGADQKLDLSDVEVDLVRSIHYAATKYMPNRSKALSWEKYLGMIVRSDVADYLKRKHAAFGNGTGERRDAEIPLQDINDDWAPTWDAASAAVHDRWQLMAHNHDSQGITALYLLWWGKCSTNGPTLDSHWHPNVGAPKTIAAALGISDSKARARVRKLRKEMPALDAGLEARRGIVNEINRFNHYDNDRVRLGEGDRIHIDGTGAATPKLSGWDKIWASKGFELHEDSCLPKEGRIHAEGVAPCWTDPTNTLCVQFGPPGPRSLGVKSVFLKHFQTSIRYLVNTAQPAPDPVKCKLYQLELLDILRSARPYQPNAPKTSARWADIPAPIDKMAAACVALEKNEVAWKRLSEKHRLILGAMFLADPRQKPESIARESRMSYESLVRLLRKVFRPVIIDGLNAWEREEVLVLLKTGKKQKWPRARAYGPGTPFSVHRVSEYRPQERPVRDPKTLPERPVRRFNLWHQKIAPEVHFNFARSETARARASRGPTECRVQGKRIPDRASLTKKKSSGAETDFLNAYVREKRGDGVVIKRWSIPRWNGGEIVGSLRARDVGPLCRAPLLSWPRQAESLRSPGSESNPAAFIREVWRYIRENYFDDSGVTTFYRHGSSLKSKNCARRA
jgi:hypothetical protein